MTSSKRSDDCGPGLRRLLDVVQRLRGPDGCPWDKEQTLKTLKPFLVEETYEVIDAIDSEDSARHHEELGDLLLQVVLQAQLRAEEGAFTFDDVADRLATKLVRRHPHVFGDVRVEGTQDVLRNWERIKAQEKSDGQSRRSLLEGIPRHLPALQKAQRVQARAARVGFDWDDIADVIAKVDEELAETKDAIAQGNAAEVEEEIGDLLFAVVNLCRFVDVQSEDALRATVGKFTNRFAQVEQRLHAQGKELRDCTLAEMDTVWEAVKAEGRL